MLLPRYIVSKQDARFLNVSTRQVQDFTYPDPKVKPSSALSAFYIGVCFGHCGRLCVLLYDFFGKRTFQRVSTWPP